MTAACSALENLCLFFATYKTISKFLLTLFEKFYVSKKLNLFFGSSTKFSMQLGKFSMHVIHWNMQSKIELWL